MATQRYISTSFWDDDWIQTLDPSEKLLFLYYMTCPLTNISGVYKITVRRVSFDTGFTQDTIGHIMQKFEKARKVFRFGEYIVIPSWPTHQKWESAPRIKDGIVSALVSLDKAVLQFLLEAGYKFDLEKVFDTLSIPYPYPRNYSDSDSDSDSDLDLESDPVEIVDSSKLVIPYLNQKTGSRFKDTKAHLTMIRARFAEGYTLDDFKAVIDKRFSKWGSDPKMAEYLRPSTLFCAKHFDEYLNDKGSTSLPPSNRLSSTYDPTKPGVTVERL